MLKQYFLETDRATKVVMVATLVLFVAALFTKGLTHDILLEAGVFLVSVKLIISTYKLSVATKKSKKLPTKLLKFSKNTQVKTIKILVRLYG